MGANRASSGGDWGLFWGGGGVGGVVGSLSRGGW